MRPLPAMWIPLCGEFKIKLHQENVRFHSTPASVLSSTFGIRASGSRVSVPLVDR